LALNQKAIFGMVYCSSAITAVRLRRRFFSGPMKWRYTAIL